MTALEILKGLKRNRNSLLWISHFRKEAAYHDGDIACRVDYESAMLVRPDPSIVIIDKTDGETLAAA
jgi:hypothetical protein